ncbi:MAG: hypothetical protein HC883_05190 [Bdellovibrionaceae bacterium]|nr:hypothetical protein [Pseudobdellovibrionaceae bacterium]
MINSQVFAVQDDSVSARVDTLSLALAQYVVAAVPVPKKFTVGDQAKYDTSLAGLPGSMTLTTKQIVPDGVWIEQINDTLFKKQVVLQLMDPVTGQLKRMIIDGKEQTPPDPANIEMVHDNPARITVPAGTFETRDILVRLIKENETSRQWVNVEDVAVLGMVKMDATFKGASVKAELTGSSRVGEK